MNSPQARQQSLARDDHHCRVQGLHCFGIATQVEEISTHAPPTVTNLRSVCMLCTGTMEPIRPLKVQPPPAPQSRMIPYRDEHGIVRWQS